MFWNGLFNIDIFCSLKDFGKLSIKLFETDTGVGGEGRVRVVLKVPYTFLLLLVLFSPHVDSQFWWFIFSWKVTIFPRLSYLLVENYTRISFVELNLFLTADISFSLFPVLFIYFFCSPGQTLHFVVLFKESPIDLSIHSFYFLFEF